MLKKLLIIGLSLFSINSYASCAVQSIVPDDQLNAIKQGKQFVFKTAHQYLIINEANSAKTYWICDAMRLEGNPSEHFEREECRHIHLAPRKTYSEKEHLFREIYFNNKHPVLVTVTTTVEGDCKTNSIISKILNVH
jgi:hypothetical protein